MSEITTLDAAHNAMQADESDGARLRFFERIAESAINTDLQTPQATATRRPRLRCHLH